MPFATDVFRSLISDLEAELAPLKTVHYNFAQIKVTADFDDKGFHFQVHAPAHVRIFIPSTYQSFPVKYIEWEPTAALDADTNIDVSMFFHHIYD